jgi:hypothetical protein
VTGDRCPVTLWFFRSRLSAIDRRAHRVENLSIVQFHQLISTIRGPASVPMYSDGDVGSTI